MENIIFLLNDHTFRIVALGCTILGVCCGILGSFAFLRKQSLLGDAVAHASLPGVCIAFLLANTKNTEYLLVYYNEIPPVLHYIFDRVC